MFEWMQFVAIGIGIGTFGSMVGLGGGLIMVPLFLLTMMPPAGNTLATVQQVIGTSLFGVLLNAVSGTWAYLKQGRVNVRNALPLALATVPGAFAGSYVASWFTGSVFTVCFGIALILLGIFVYTRSRVLKKNPETAVDVDAQFAAKRTLAMALSFVVGFISSIFGIGGGIIHVPMMVFILGLPMHVAVATSTFVLMVSSCVGVAGHAWLNHIVWEPAVAIGIGAMIGAQIGAVLSKKSKSSLLMAILSVAMVGVGVQLICRGLL